MKQMSIPKARKLPSGKYNIQLRLGGKSYSITESTPQECESKAFLIKSQHANGILADEFVPINITLSEAIMKYNKERSNTLSPSTIRGYETIRRTRFKAVMDRPIRSVTNWQRVINDEAATCSAKTLRNAWGLVTTVLDRNGFDIPSVTLPQRIPKERPWLEDDQIKIFCKAIEGSQYEIGCLLALHGLRRSELLAVDKSSFDLKKRTIRVSGAVVKGNDGYVKKKTNKNDSSVRVVPIMIPRLYELIKETDVYVPYKPDTLRTYINRICRQNNLPETSVHGLRHSFCSLCFHLGVPPEQCMVWGGWKELSTMNKIYKHISSSDSNKYKDMMTSFFENG